ncbi:cupin domain-containing protein [Blastopirellula marina]|uniref:Phosphoribosylaminoimidazole carboxylase n=1 Tax=Blastopirellula marina TaxID=124 RepID=A0A2S8FNT3_9BACT|nr:cupin domain-containing protein [Blastopirellula marina]PQO33846.1 phosphoribosylaminoimidazole carboxylase [Blastopirellula marina]PTL43633.1 cupin domain-containing protein [Blastopirellula marina]
MELTNFFHDVPSDLPDELIQTLVQQQGVRIERIISQGHASPEGFWYDQAEHEFVIVLSGSAQLRIEGEPTARQLSPGDFVNIPAHQKHRVDATDPNQVTLWLAVFYGGSKS